MHELWGILNLSSETFDNSKMGGTYLFCDPPSKIVENLLLGVVFRVEHESGVFF